MIAHGKIHGTQISLDTDVGFPEGQRVRVIVTPESSWTEEERRDAIVRSAGAWAADGAELDEYLEWVRRQRKISRRDPE